METIDVSDRREFVDAVMEEDLDLSKEGADELFDIWEYRYKYGADEEYLVFVPDWMAENDFGRKWPYFFAEIEHDDEDKGAVLFTNAQMIDPSIVENQVWSKVEMDDVLVTLDISDENDFVDSKSMCWVARSQMTTFEMTE